MLATRILHMETTLAVTLFALMISPPAIAELGGESTRAAVKALMK